jgi:hypothetical protein
MEREVLFTGELEAWWISLTESEQDAVDRVVRMLATLGIDLPFPYSSGIKTSAYAHMRELRIKHQGHQLGVLYAFDPARNAVLLIGGDKTGNDRWYEIFMPRADRIYAEYLKERE